MKDNIDKHHGIKKRGDDCVTGEAMIDLGRDSNRQVKDEIFPGIIGTDNVKRT